MQDKLSVINNGPLTVVINNAYISNKNGK